jgi:hypothetical protein
MLIRILRAVAPPGIRSTVRNAVAHEPDPGVRGLAYRIGQDALAWAFERVREGEVEQEGEIAVDVETADEGTLVRVRCDACGTAASSEDDAALVSIRERADLAGGWGARPCPGVGRDDARVLAPRAAHGRFVDWRRVRGRS